MMNKIIWLTGQPGSGKTTIAKELLKYFETKKIKSINVDGDDLRELMENKDYSKSGRFKNIKLAQRIALFCQNKKFQVIVSLVAPYLELREEFKNKTDVFEIYLYTSEKRGREHFFSKDYEKPIDNYISIDTTNKTVKECVDEILTIYR